MRYGFTDDGFAVVDDDKKIGAFAYYSSPRWRQACREPELIAKRLLDSSTWSSPTIREEHYLHICESLTRATRWPKKIA